jgi:glycosyltransferase involved in cell wall biosynthesis
VTPIACIILTLNEEAALTACIDSVRAFTDEIVVVDSGSTDKTVAIAAARGCEVMNFAWTGRYPKKKQWALDHLRTEADWVLLLDADERLAAPLAQELLQIAETDAADAVDIPISYFWRGRELRYGQVVKKRSFLKRSLARFPDVGDESLPGITEVEGHYQPQVTGRTVEARNRLLHDDPGLLTEWFGRHNRYSDWEAGLRLNPVIRSRVRGNRSRQGQLFERLPFKSAAVFIYCYIVKGGWRDGVEGFEYAWSLAFYQSLIAMKVREAKGRATSAGRL